MCDHTPSCPAADASDARSAHIRTPHPEQGWCLLCNGVISFDDGAPSSPMATSSPRPRTPRDPTGTLARLARVAAQEPPGREPLGEQWCQPAGEGPLVEP